MIDDESRLLWQGIRFDATTDDIRGLCRGQQWLESWVNVREVFGELLTV